jgi:membrane-associated protein
VKAEEVLLRYGPGKAIVLARFIPIVRTFLNPLMGAGSMSAATFAKWNVVGGVLWGTGVTLLGYFLGNVTFIGKNLEFFAIGIVLISVLPIAFELLRARRNNRV